MDTLLKSVTIVHEPSEFHRQKVDILIQNGIIAAIGEDILIKDCEVIAGHNLYCTIGLCDIGTHSGEPGLEHRETIYTMTKSALNGGFTALAIMPDTNPITQTKSQIQYLNHHPDRHHVALLPIGALSKDLKGQDIGEYYDMSGSGAVAFSDGLQSVQNSGLLGRALQYASATDRLVIHHADDHTLSSGSEMHEGKTSTQLGMKGTPSIAEIHIVHRDTLLLEYNMGKLLTHAISASESVEMVRSAKNRGLHLYASVPYLNLILTDEALSDFDQNLKVIPPLRSYTDRQSLIDGLKDGTIDTIISNHVPLNEEVKNLEFSYALPGASGLDTCLIACLTFLKNELDMEILIDKLAIRPRKILNLTMPDIAVGARANLCVFDTESTWTFQKSDITSKSPNNPFIGKTFTSKVVFTIC